MSSNAAIARAASSTPFSAAASSDAEGLLQEGGEGPWLRAYSVALVSGRPAPRNGPTGT
jgi:hypothetical protein